MVLPLLKNDASLKWVKVGCLGVWLLVAVLQRPLWITKLDWRFWLLPCWLLLISLSGLFVDSVGLWENIGSILLFFICAFMYDYYASDRGALTFLVITTLVTFVAGAVMSITVLLINPMAARLVTTGAYEDLATTGVGEFRFTYAIALLLPCLVMILASKQTPRWVRIAVLVISLCFLYYQYLASFAMAIIVCMIGIALSGIFLIRRRNIRNWVFTLAGVCVLLFLMGFTSEFFNTISERLDNETLARKAHELSMIGKDTSIDASMDLSKRWDQYAMSLNTFAEHPLIGVGPYMNYEQARIFGISMHSEWLDMLARFGLCGALPFLYLFISLLRKANHPLRHTPYGKLITAQILILLALGLMNPILGISEIGVVIFLLWYSLPLVCGLT